MNKKKSISNNKSPKEDKFSKFFPIVGIGASAGGLEALEIFFENMPSDKNIAFVVIQHLDPKHKSIMASLLTKYTDMKIQEAEDGMVVKPDCVYLTPPNKNMVILNRVLYLMEPEKIHSVNLPINHFFRSLSNDLAEKAICIILSGTGTDGTLGAEEIKSNGGMTMAQNEKQAKYDGMPHSAIKTGLIDFILPVEKMPETLVKYINHPFVLTSGNIEVSKHQSENDLNKIFALIRSETGHDFSNYKQNTIQRRIERRLATHQIKRLTDYIHYMQQTPAEIEILFRDMLITVTSFFRDPECYDVVKQKVLPNLFKIATTDLPLRIWVPGCATGEEAYSIAILLVEAMSDNQIFFPVQIFATDIDDEAIEIARQGKYPDSIAADVSSQRLKKFFVKDGKKYVIKKQIREMVIFATQSLIKDPPFSKLHLVSCRNLLIYMDQVLQKKILPLFHYTLNKEGILILGSSESVGEFSDLFSTINKKWKIFQRQDGNLKIDKDFHRNLSLKGSIQPQTEESKTESYNIDVHDLAQKLILDEYSPSFVVVNEIHEIIYFSGETEKYLSPPVGKANFNILEMARDSIKFKISSMLMKAMKYKKSITIENLQIKHQNRYLTIDLIIRPIIRKGGLPIIFIVIFKDKLSVNKTGEEKKKIPLKKVKNQRLITLEQELQYTREYLQTAVEELETLNEEQKSINEEMQSTNEELQSTNEELETSKEELQSTNEELSTVNSELQNKIDELTHVNNDINNLLANTEIGTIFLDSKLCIKRFTPSMTQIFNLINSDLDRPISDITANFIYTGLVDDAKVVLATLMSKEIEVQNKSNTWFSVRISPYRTTDNMIDGVVITFVDITKIKEVENVRRLATVVNDSNDAITLIDLQGNFLAWNKGAINLYGYSEAEALQMNMDSLLPESRKHEVSEFIEEMKSGKLINSFVTKRKSKDGTINKIWLTVTKLTDENGIINTIATTERDLSVLEKIAEI